MTSESSAPRLLVLTVPISSSLSSSPSVPRDDSWTTVTELVSLNTPPLANGLLYIYINDTLVLAQTGLVWRTDESVILSRVLFSTFFGGSSKSYYPPKDEQAFFRGFTVSLRSLRSSRVTGLHTLCRHRRTDIPPTLAQVYSSDSASNTTGPAVNATLYTPESISSASALSIAVNWLVPFIVALLLHSFFA